MTTQNVPESLVRFNNVRISFPHLATPRPARMMPDGKMSKSKYEASLLVLPTAAEVQAFNARITKLLQEMYKEHWQGALQKFMGDRKTRCFGQGEECVDSTTFQVLKGYAGHLYINAKSDRQPALYGADGNPLMDASAIYGGCRVNAYIQPWLQKNEGGGIRAELIAVQFAGDDEPFGAAPIDTTGLFAAVPGAPAPVVPGFGTPAAPAPTAQGFGVPAPTAAGFPSSPAPAVPGFGVPPTPNGFGF